MTKFIAPAVNGADIAPRSISVSPGPHTNTLLGDTTVATPSGIVSGQVWDFGGVGHHAGQFGCKFDGVTDDTVAFQKFVDFITNETALLTSGMGSRGLLPPGVAIVSSAGAGTPCINFSRRPGWSIRGTGIHSSIVRCATDNAPIFNLGSDTASVMNSWAIEDLEFDYVNVQPATNTTANPILFSAMGYQAKIARVMFTRGFYAMRTAAGIVRMWASTLDDIVFGGGLSGGAIDNSAASTAGVPNNHWGRISVDLGGSSGMAGPVFNGFYGQAFSVDTIEFFNGPGTNAALMAITAGTEVWIGSMRLEVSAGTYTSGATLFDIGASCSIRIGTLDLSGATLGVSAAVTLLAFNVGNGSKLTIGTLDISGTMTLTNGGIARVFQSGTSAGTAVVVDNFGALTGGGFPIAAGWVLTDPSGAATQEVLTIRDWTNGHLSQNKGDASYAITLGDPSIVAFETAFSAQRTVTLPGTDATRGNLPNGLWYRIRCKGAINGTNTLLVVCNGVTLLTQATDLVVLEFTYRRDPSHPQTGWKMTGFQTALPA